MIIKPKECSSAHNMWCTKPYSELVSLAKPMKFIWDAPQKEIDFDKAEPTLTIPWFLFSELQEFFRNTFESRDKHLQDAYESLQLEYRVYREGVKDGRSNGR